MNPTARAVVFLLVILGLAVSLAPRQLFVPRYVDGGHGRLATARAT